MKLSDVMSAMHLSSYAIAALVLFLLAFTAVAVDLLRRGRELEALARLPLDPDEDQRAQARREAP